MDRMFIDIPEGRIYYRTDGEGPPLLILHPHTYSSELFSGVIPLLAARYRVIAPDRMGHGLSDPIPNSFQFMREYEQPGGENGPSFPYEDDMRVALHILDGLGIERAIILGQHGGAHIGIEMGIIHPQRVEKLVLVSIPDWADEAERQQVLRTLESEGPEMKIAMDGSHLMEQWRQKRDWSSPSTTPQILDKVAMLGFRSRGPWRLVPPMVINNYHVTERLPLLRVPTMLLAGAQDHAGRFTDHQRTLLHEDTRVKSAIVEGAGAFFALEKPEEFARQVLKFLA